ncbi:MAG: alpha-amylase [Azospira oryzae]|jgi:glycosidase|nr:MAG: alpha-amylase [Azospira oryzae]
MKSFSRFTLPLILLVACSAPKEKIPDTMLSDTKPAQKTIIYQVMTRLFGNTQLVNKKYGTLEENGVGKFADFNDAALNGIKELGVTHIWYTGVIEHALLTDYTQDGIPLDDADVVKGRAGSPYAIKDYYDVNPDLATNVKERMQEFEQLVQRTHDHDLKVIIDFVPNHVARHYHSDVKPEGVKDLGETDDKSVSFKASNNFYYLPGTSFQPPKEYNALGPENSFPTKDGKFAESPAKATGNDQFTATPGINEWFETIKLNYGVDIQNNHTTHFDPVPDTWNKMLAILLFWASKNVDGFRCDMAEMVPVEFWKWAIPQVKAAHPGIIFIAEVYNPQQYKNYIDNGRFDYLYDKVQLYDALRLLINQKAKSSDVADIQKNLEGINHNMLHFLENHDEQRIASPQFATDPWKALPGMVVSALVDRGPVMIYFGQEVGEPGAGAEGFGGDDGRTTLFDYWTVPEHYKWVNGGKYDGGLLSDEQKQLRQFYGDILTFAKSNRAIAAGDYFDITKHNVALKNITEQVVTFVRSSGEERLVIVAGFNTETQRVKIQLPMEVVSKMAMNLKGSYMGRDLLRSGTDVGLDETFSFELDVPPHSAFIFKIK